MKYNDNKDKKTMKITIAVLLVLVLATSGMFAFGYSNQKNNKEKNNKENIDNLENTLSISEEENTNLTDDKNEEKKEESKSVVVPESERVDDSYFDDVVFIGNSRTQGLMLYGGISNAKFYADKGLMVNKIKEKPISIPGMAQKTTVLNALNQNVFGKYYIMLGTNELGWAYENIFIENYAELIDDIKKLNPSAEIYIESILPVSKEKSDNEKIYTNEKIDHMNELLMDLAKEKDVNFLNVAEAFKDETGSLFAEKSSDGVHLKADACKEWADYLYTHTVQDGTSVTSSNVALNETTSAENNEEQL